MQLVAIYKYLGVFPARTDLAGMSPVDTVTCQGILFLRQPGMDRDDAAATAECLGKYGLRRLEIQAFGLLDMGALQKPHNKQFVDQYEQALREGSALVYYPPDSPGLTPASAADDAVTYSGFNAPGR